MTTSERNQIQAVSYKDDICRTQFNVLLQHWIKLADFSITATHSVNLMSRGRADGLKYDFGAIFSRFQDEIRENRRSNYTSGRGRY